MSTMPFRISLLTIAIGLALLTSAATANTYRCDAVQDLARLGYGGDEEVSVFGSDNVCKFSIGGVSADGIVLPYDRSRAQEDRSMLTNDTQRFIVERLTPVIHEAAAAFGDAADFVGGLNIDSDLSDLSCSSGNTVSVDTLQLRCVKTTDSEPILENQIISAILFRPTFVFEVIDTETTALVIFIPALTQ